MKFGDTVIYTENEVEYVATVLRSRELDDHLGVSGEPLLDLGFFKAVSTIDGSTGEPVVQDVVGTNRQSELVQFRIDVAHESHEFDDKAKAKYHRTYGGTSIPQEDNSVSHTVIYPGGRWREQEISTFTGRQEGQV